MPIVPSRIGERDAAEDRDAMVHALAVQRVVDVAMAAEKLGREDAVEHLRLLEAENVRLLLGDQTLDQPGARAHRVDVPRSDLQPFAHEVPLTLPQPTRKRPPLRGRGARADQAFVTQGIPRARVTGGNPKQVAESKFYLGSHA